MDSSQASDQAREAVTPGKLVVISALVAVLFFFGLLFLERIPEIPVDIDQKPFFIPLLFVALLPLGKPTWAAAAGAALGEGLGDIIEGYEVDDVFGLVGYVIAFAVAGYIIYNRPDRKIRLAVAGLVAGLVQAIPEASAFLLFGEEALPVAVVSAAGNTVTHGLLWGAVPLLLVVPALHGRVERLLGFPALGKESV